MDWVWEVKERYVSKECSLTGICFAAKKYTSNTFTEWKGSGLDLVWGLWGWDA